MNFKDLVTKVAAREGGAVNLSIAQISEVVRYALAEISKLPSQECEKLLAAAARRERTRLR